MIVKRRYGGHHYGQLTKRARYGREVVRAAGYAATGNWHGAAAHYGPRVLRWGARKAGQYARKRFDEYFRSRGNRPTKVKSVQKSVGRKYHTLGGYHGKFRKGRKLREVTSVYANKGVLLTSEINGIVSDPDCVYITHTACDTYKVIVEATDALFRKLFEKAGFNIANMDQLVGHTSLTNSADWQIQLTEYAGQTGVETVNTVYTTVAASTVKSIAGQFYNSFLSFSAGQTYTGSGAAATDSRLYRLILYTQDYNVTYAPTFFCAINLDDEMLHLYACSDLRIQNRTLAADASADAEDVSNNPLVGRSYEFPRIPMVRDKSAFPLNAIPVNQGVQLVRAAQLTTNTGYKQPPSPTVFSNCRRSAHVRLNPGDVKSSKIVVKKRMNFIEFLRKVNLQYGVTPGFYVYHSIFPSEIFALEDLINVNHTQNISCAYEANQVIGVYLQTKKKATGVVTYSTATFSNVP